MADIFDQIQSSKGTGDVFDSIDVPKEGFLKNLSRTALQIPQGIAEGTKAGIGTGLWQLLGMGEALDPEEIDRIREISEREGIPFDEEKYMEAAQQALGAVPTVSNIASKIEEKTGLPLEPKEWYQKALRLGSMSSKIQPGTLAQKATAGIAAPSTSIALESAGIPEPLAEIAGLAVGGAAGSKSNISLTKTKKSGLPARQYENLKKPRKVAPEKIEKINEKLEKDFRDISEDILSTSPIEETRSAIKENPAFKAEVSDKFKEVEILAELMPEKINTDNVKKTLVNNALKKKGTGFSPSEYDKDFNKFILGFVKETPSQEIGAVDLVKQYRKNNKALSEYFSPGESKAHNRAKKDALLEYNRAIAETIETEYPNSEFSELFKDTNKMWADISDAESVDSFIDNLFKEGPQFRKGKKIFESENQARPFKRAMGEENFKRFEQLMKDMLNTEKPYSMLKPAESKGFFKDMGSTIGAYVLHPHLAHAKVGLDAAKSAWRGAVDLMLDKPQLTFTWKKAISDLKKGDFKSAEKQFDILKSETDKFKSREESKKNAVKKFNERRKLISNE